MNVVESSDHAGWIYKQGSLVRTWKRRFMILKGQHITYYNTATITPKVKPKGSMHIIVVEYSTEIKNGLLVHGSGGRVLKMYTDSEANCAAWYQAFQQAINAKGIEALRMTMAQQQQDIGYSRSGSVDIDSESDQSLPDIDFNAIATQNNEGITHSGWLHKEGNHFKSWKRRYFTLVGRVLTYFDSAEMGSNAKGRGYVLNVHIWEGKPFSLKITFEHGRVLCVSADSQLEMDRWYEALKDTLEKRGATLIRRSSLGPGQKYERESIFSESSEDYHISNPSSRASTCSSSSSGSRLAHSRPFVNEQQTPMDRWKATGAVGLNEGLKSVPEYSDDSDSYASNSTLSDESEGDWI